MKGFKPLPILLVSLLFTACGEIRIGGEAEHGDEMAGEHAAGPANVTRESSSEEKIASALSAAPDIVSAEATVVDWPASPDEAPALLREGTNEWACFPSQYHTPGHDPMCFDGAAQNWAGAWMAQQEPNLPRMGLSYMLEGSYDNSNTDPFAPVPPEDEFVVTGPHVMIFPVDPTSLDGMSTDHTTGEPYVMFQGTPWAHLMMPTN